ncbi:MAG: TonB-dependent receptor [Burkholderiaceae bacterium]
MDYRAGIKSFWLGNRLRVNAGIFNIKWDDQQLSGSSTTKSVNGQAGAMSYVDNIGKSRIRGLEVESEFLISSE